MSDKKTLSIIRTIMDKHLDYSQYKVFIFGSRTKPAHRKYCDVDIGIMGTKSLPTSTLLGIKEDLQNSDIPYMCDVVDLRKASPDFREKALSKVIPI